MTATMKLAFSNKLRALRKQRQWTQVQLAKHISSSQSRIAKMEAGDPGVSMDLLIRSLLALGASKKDLAKVMSSSSSPRSVV